MTENKSAPSRASASQPARPPAGFARWGHPLFLLGTALILSVLSYLRLGGSPRLWAEEGAHYFELAWRAGSLEALSTPVFIYHHIVPRLAALFATWIPLELAPYLTMGAALGVTLAVVLLIATSPADFLRDPRHRLILVAALFLLPTAGEVRLTTIHSQFFLCFASLLVAIEGAFEASGSDRRGFNKALALALVGLAAADSLIAGAALPFHLWNAYRSKSRTQIQIALVALLVTGIHGGWILAHWQHFQSELSLRQGARDTFMLPFYSGWTSFLVPILGREATLAIPTDWLYRARESEWRIPTFLALVALQLVLLWLLSRGPLTRRIALMLAAMTALQASAQIAIADRYSFVPALLLLCIALATRHEAPRAPRGHGLKAKFACGFLLWVGLLIAYDLGRTADLGQRGPIWQHEVEAWRKDPMQPLGIWPRGWQLPLGPVQETKTSDLGGAYREDESAAPLRIEILGTKAHQSLLLGVKGATPGRPVTLSVTRGLLPETALFGEEHQARPRIGATTVFLIATTDESGEATFELPFDKKTLHRGFTHTLQAAELSPKVALSAALRLDLARGS